MAETAGQRKRSITTHSCEPEPQSASFMPDVTLPGVSQQNFGGLGRTEEISPHPIPGLAADILHMRVKEGSKIHNLLRLATARMQGERKEVVFTGSGRGITKTITCVEILKRKVGGLHQVSKLYYKTVTDAPRQQAASNVTTHRTVPAICILLSKDALDPQEPGYQPPQTQSVPPEDTETLVRTDLSSSSQQTSKRLCLNPLGVCSSLTFRSSTV